MTSKRLLALLMAVSLAFQQAVKAEDVITPEDTVETTEVVTPEQLDTTVEKTTDVKETVEDAVSDVAEIVEDAAADVADTVQDAAADVADVVAPAVDEVIAAAKTDSSTNDDATSDEPTMSSAGVTALRCILFFAAKNAIRALMKASYYEYTAKNEKSYLKAGTLSADNYLGHLLTYGVDVVAPYKDSHEVSGAQKGAEFLAKEISIIGEAKVKDSALFNWTASLNAPAGTKMFFKALNRNKLFILPESVKAVLKHDVVSMTTGMLEGLEYDSSKTEWTNAISRKGCKDSFFFGQVAMRSNGLAKDLIALSLMKGYLPEAVVNFMGRSDANMELCENLLAQIIEDGLNQTYKSAGM